MICLDNLSPEDLLLLSNAVAISLSKDKDVNEINVLGNFLVGTGSLMLIIAAQQQLLLSSKQDNTTT
ncbi:hypothetical protein KPL42_00475 [Clostridium gasigenes]|uniref:hypothetical protein n=1 Tax=Clostridium gasigenes TaxID=94869 RepID=UPI001C0E328B|nr:hypothetical protein [Clostridium gasigenes]MBU3086958.1 hypothetical protein [Clostridium gasigenes]MBU3106339.1 hypothetical protein [Clostridium gasigenes]